MKRTVSIFMALILAVVMTAALSACSGKTIVPFNTHGGSGFSGTQQTIAKLEPNATMLEGKSISRNSIEGAEQEIIDWLQSIGMLRADR